MPVLVIAGARAGGDFLVRQTQLVASNVTPVVLAEAGHWLIDERPRETVDALARFLSAAPGQHAQR
jgi:pimeloyl-ACP methyl ester carboxylesterase